MATNFKQSVTEYGAIMEQIKKRDFCSIYLLHGEEPYFIDKISDLIASTVLTNEDKDFNQEVIYGSDLKSHDVINLARTVPMFSERRVIIVREANQISDFAKLESYLDSISHTTVLVLCYKGKAVDKRSSLYKKIANSKECAIFDSYIARDYEVKGFLDVLVKSHGYTLDIKAKEMLVEYLGTDLMKIDSEINKLSNALSGGEKTITPAIVEQYIGISKDYNVFELIDAISIRDITKALRIIDYFGSNPKASPPTVTIPLLFKYFLSIFVLGMTLAEHQKKGIRTPSNAELAKTAKISSPFLVDKYISSTKYFPPNKSFYIIELLRKYDMKCKGVETGSLNDKELMRELILKILYI